MKNLIAMFMFVFACSGDNVPHAQGDYLGTCNKDGSCNSPNLKCSNDRCRVREEDHIPYDVRNATIFCDKCVQSCGALGVKLRNYSDSTVWGASPSVCECK